MIYLRAGLYAEGRSDYDFLLPLLDRLLDALAASLFPGACEVGPTVGIDAPPGTAPNRAERISAAIHDWWDTCTLFVVHADGAGDAARARDNDIAPGLAAARATSPERAVPAAACVPVREIEAWLLVDPAVFRAILGEAATPVCPADPEREPDPKATLRRILHEGGARRPPAPLHAFFGERVRLDALRVLPAFQAFEIELVEAIHQVARGEGHPR